MKKHPEKTISELRRFGLTLGLVISLFFGLIIPFLRNQNFTTWPFTVSTTLILLACILPNSLRLIEVVFSNVSKAIGFVNTRIILSMIYFTVIVPIGIIKKFGKNQVAEKESYRIVRETEISMEHPY